jgi:hypothetical protein
MPLKTIKAPCALTTSVLVHSLNSGPSLRGLETTTGTSKLIRWLRRFFSHRFVLVSLGSPIVM